MRMRDIKSEAKKKRAKFLAQLPRFQTVTELAEFHGVSCSYMSKVILQAKKEAEVQK